MNLSSRASFVILPVLVISYVLIAFLIYQQESASIKQLELGKLELRGSALKNEFTSYERFLNAYLVSLVEAEALARFIREPDSIYKERELTTTLKASIQRYFSNTLEFASLSVLDSENKVLVYVENSTDPFAQIRPELVQMSAEMLDKKRTNYSKTFSDKTINLMAQGAMIDSRTLTAPLTTQLEDTLQVIVSVSPTGYSELLRKTIHQYSAEIQHGSVISSFRHAENQISTSVELKPDYYLTITSSPLYLERLFAGLLANLFLILMAAVFITYFLLLALIKRFITSPISLLDQQLTDVIEKNRQNIEVPDSSDEIGRLGRKFQNLYSQLHLAFKESHAQSRTDALTHLPNRAAFYEEVSKQLSQAEKQHLPLSIIYIDLDNFKFVNDKYGHEMGDELLKAVATRLAHILELKPNKLKGSQVYRLSGDEFIIMLPETESSVAQKLSKKIIQQFANGYQFELGHFPVTACLGISSYPEDGHTISQLVSNADLAMYQAKKSGKNTYATYSQELAKKDRQIKEIESHLKEVDFDREFSLYYMPIIDRSGSVKGCEALLRWTSPQLGFVSPALFIPIAEQTGCFKDIDLWVTEQVFKEYEQVSSLLEKNVEISINISSAEIGSDKFITHLQSLLLKHETDPANFVIEITETFAMEGSQSPLAWLESLRELGFKIAIDDFGTGYTSLMQMVDYPVDTIKFDKALVERLTTDDKRPLAKALIDICHLQDITVVAEGVETREDMEAMCKAGCDYQQGFYIAKPMPVNDIESWINKFRKSDLIKSDH